MAPGPTGGRSPLTLHFGRKMEAHFPANPRFTVTTWNISRAVAEDPVTSPYGFLSTSQRSVQLSRECHYTQTPPVIRNILSKLDLF